MPPSAHVGAAAGLASLVAVVSEVPAAVPQGPGLASLLAAAEQALLPDEPLAQALAAYQVLRARWAHDPVAYARQRLGLTPTWQQEAMLRALAPEGAKVSVRAGHGLGKSGCLAGVIWWFLETRDFAKVPCTGPSSHQLRDVLWSELSKWRRSADAVSQARGDHPRVWLSRLFESTTERVYDRSAAGGVVRRGADRQQGTAGGLERVPRRPGLLVVHPGGSRRVSWKPRLKRLKGRCPRQGPGSSWSAIRRATPGPSPPRTSSTAANTPRYISARQDSPLVDPEYRPRLVRKFGEGSNVVRVRADGEFPQAR